MRALRQDIGCDAHMFVKSPDFTVFVMLVASFIPARRAARIDPMMALRYE